MMMKCGSSSVVVISPPFVQLPFNKNKRLTFVTPVSAAANSIKSELSLCVGTHVIPHPDKMERGGEDAFFISNHNPTVGVGVGGGAIARVIAVADGVSGWAEHNVDPALFSRELIANASSMLDEDDPQVNDDPQLLLRNAHAATSSKGSATLIVAMMGTNGILKIANVGDCGLRVIRKGQVMFATSPQEHYFDCPYQLSSEASTQTYLDAFVSTVKLVEGDIVILGSDGLFDNVYDRQIASTIATHKDVTEAAKALARLARQHSMDPSFDSPYSTEARTKGIDVPDWKKLLGMKLIGGKLDDITVLVAAVVKLKL